MHRKIHILPLIILLFAAFASCTEKVEIELGTTYTRLVVYGEITTDTTTHSVKLLRSADYFYNRPAEGISNANVWISDGNDSIQLAEDPLIHGLYQTPADHYGIAGKTYRLFIDNVDINNDGTTESYSASSYLPPINKLDSINLKYTSNSFFTSWEVQVWTWDPADSRDFYSFKVLKNGKMLTDTLTDFIVQSDDFFNGNFTYGITMQVIDQNDPSEAALPGDTIEFQANGITREYFVFILEAQAEAFGNNPLFSGPPANISTNLSNGALGFFTAYSISRAQTIVPELPE